MTDGGIRIPSAFDVFWLPANSNSVGCSTGMLPGFTPLRTLAAMSPARANVLAGRGARRCRVSANDIGAIAGPMIGGFVLYFPASFSATYLAVGALGVATAIVVLLLPEVDRMAAREARTFSAREGSA